MKKENSERSAWLIVISVILLLFGLSAFFLLNYLNTEVIECPAEPTTAIVTVIKNENKTINNRLYEPFNYKNFKKDEENIQRVYLTGTVKTVNITGDDLYMDIEVKTDGKKVMIAAGYTGDDIPDIKTGDEITVYGVSYGIVSMYEKNYKIKEYYSVHIEKFE